MKVELVAVPLALVTTTVTLLMLLVPRLGTVAVNDVALAILTLLWVPLKVTVVPATKLAPLMVTVAPAAADDGEIAVICGVTET